MPTLSAAEHLTNALTRIENLQRAGLRDGLFQLTEAIRIDILAAQIALKAAATPQPCAEGEHDFVEECSRCGLDPSAGCPP